MRSGLHQPYPWSARHRDDRESLPRQMPPPEQETAWEIMAVRSQLVAFLSTIGVDRIEHDFPRPELYGLFGPCQGVEISFCTATVNDDAV
jgi:hypothetical protein